MALFLTIFIIDLVSQVGNFVILIAYIHIICILYDQLDMKNWGTYFGGGQKGEVPRKGGPRKGGYSYNWQGGWTPLETMRS